MGKTSLIILLAVVVLVLGGCSTANKNNSTQSSPQGQPGGEVQKSTYTQIDGKTAKNMMDTTGDYIILDVRTKAEYDGGHIPQAVLLPNEEIATQQPLELPDKEQVILVYCRSGNRSKQAAQKLADLGYINVYEFGGINTWAYDIVK